MKLSLSLSLFADGRLEKAKLYIGTNSRFLTYEDELVALSIGDLVRSEDVAHDRQHLSGGRGAVDDARDPHGVSPRQEPGGGEVEKGHLKEQLKPNDRHEPRRVRLGHEVIVVAFGVELLFRGGDGARIQGLGERNARRREVKSEGGKRWLRGVKQNVFWGIGSDGQRRPCHDKLFTPYVITPQTLWSVATVRQHD